MRKIALFTSFLLVLASCMQEEKKSAPEAAPVRVTLTKAQTIAYKIPVHASGILTTSSQMKLSFKTGGIIKKVYAKEGTSVKKGKVLARLDLAEIDATVQQARIGAEKAERDLKRAKNLYADSVATLEQYENAQSAFEFAKSQLRIASFNLRHSTIKAPSNGKIQKVLVEDNELVGPGYPAIVFASTADEWVVRVPVTDKDIVKLRLGDSAHIQMDPFPGVNFVAELSQLASVADPMSGTYEVELMIPKAHPQFRTGFISRVEIFPTKKYSAMVVPIECLLNANKYNADVFIHSEGKALARKLKIGSIIGENVIVEEGLMGNEELILEGAQYLRDGHPVKIEEAEK